MFYQKTEPFFQGMEQGYKNLLQKFIQSRWLAWVIVVLCILLTFFIGRNLQSELAPLEDRSSIRFQLSGPEGASYGYMNKAGEEFGNFLIDSIPERSFSFIALPGFGGTGEPWSPPRGPLFSSTPQAFR